MILAILALYSDQAAVCDTKAVPIVSTSRLQPLDGALLDDCISLSSSDKFPDSAEGCSLGLLVEIWTVGVEDDGAELKGAVASTEGGPVPLSAPASSMFTASVISAEFLTTPLRSSFSGIRKI